MLTPAGTQLYSAPELLFGLDWNERVDIWASGLCLYFMVTAKLPFNLQSQRVRRQLEIGRNPSPNVKSIKMKKAKDCSKNSYFRKVTF